MQRRIDGLEATIEPDDRQPDRRILQRQAKAFMAFGKRVMAALQLFVDTSQRLASDTVEAQQGRRFRQHRPEHDRGQNGSCGGEDPYRDLERSEERRVGHEGVSTCCSRCSPEKLKKKKK